MNTDNEPQAIVIQIEFIFVEMLVNFLCVIPLDDAISFAHFFGYILFGIGLKIMSKPNVHRNGKPSFRSVEITFWYIVI